MNQTREIEVFALFKMKEKKKKKDLQNVLWKCLNLSLSLYYNKQTGL